jgi:hypothetical protein
MGMTETVDSDVLYCEACVCVMLASRHELPATHSVSRKNTFQNASVSRPAGSK